MKEKLFAAVLGAAAIAAIAVQMRQGHALGDDAAIPVQVSHLGAAGTQADKAVFSLPLQGDSERRSALHSPALTETVAEQSHAIAQASSPPVENARVLAGVLVVPREWHWNPEVGGSLEFRLSRNGKLLKTIDSFVSMPGADLRLAWRMDDAPFGDVRVSFAPLQARWSVTVPAQGREDVELIVPGPADLLVRVVGEDGGILSQTDLDQGHLTWSCPLGRNDSYRRIPMGPPGSDGLYGARVPAGEIEIHFDHPDYPLTYARVEAKAGRVQNVTLLAIEACGVIVKSVDRDGNPASPPLTFSLSEPTFELLSPTDQVHASHAVNDPYVRSRQLSSNGIRYTLTVPGHYRYHHWHKRSETGVPLREVVSGRLEEESYEVLVYPGEYTELVVTVED